VYDSEREASDLLVLHAQDFTGIRWRPSTFLFACPTASTATGERRDVAPNERGSSKGDWQVSLAHFPPSEQPQPLPREKSWSMTARWIGQRLLPLRVG